MALKNNILRVIQFKNSIRFISRMSDIFQNYFVIFHIPKNVCKI